jgi:hypothetical protein
MVWLSLALEYVHPACLPTPRIEVGVGHEMKHDRYRLNRPGAMAVASSLHPTRLRLTRSPRRAGEQRRRDVQAESLCSVEIDHELVLHQLYHREVPRLLALQQATGIEAGLPVSAR